MRHFALLCILALGFTRSAMAQANCPGNVTTSWTANQDYQVTSNTDCIVVGASGLTINLGNHKIICNNAGGCGTAINSGGYASTYVHDGYIVAGTGKWTFGFVNGSSGGQAFYSQLVNVSMDNMTAGVVQPYTVTNSIFTNMSLGCIIDYLVITPAGNVFSNYCRTNASNSFGILIAGPATLVVSRPSVYNNVVNTASTATALSISGYALADDNIIAGGGAVSVGANVTHAGNLCPGSTGCPDAEPGSNFGTQPDFSLGLSSN